MLEVFGRQNIQYSGDSSYRYVERLIRNGRKVLIISPYVDDYYARFLLANSNGREIHLLSSSVESGTRRKLERKAPWYRIVLYAFIIILVECLLYVIGAGLEYLLLYPAAISIALYVLSIPRRVRLKVPKSFVHAKMYISEDEAIRGSANLTYNGMHRNIEHIEVVRDRNEIGKMRKDFWMLWNSS